MNGVIRKVSVGGDYKTAMHYIVGQRVLSGAYQIEHIVPTDRNSIEVWIVNDVNEMVLWKEFTNNMPCSLEFNIDF